MTIADAVRRSTAAQAAATLPGVKSSSGVAEAGVRLPVRDERTGLEAVWLVRNPDWAELLGPGAELVIRHDERCAA